MIIATNVYLTAIVCLFVIGAALSFPDIRNEKIKNIGSKLLMASVMGLLPIAIIAAIIAIWK